MRLTNQELAAVRRAGLYITQKCDRCGKLLNQTFRYTLNASDPDAKVWCSRECQDTTMAWDKPRASRVRGPEFYLLRCQRQSCGHKFRAKRQDARFCSNRCRQIEARRQKRLVVTDKRQTPI